MICESENDQTTALLDNYTNLYIPYVLDNTPFLRCEQADILTDVP